MEVHMDFIIKNWYGILLAVLLAISIGLNIYKYSKLSPAQ